MGPWNPILVLRFDGNYLYMLGNVISPGFLFLHLFYIISHIIRIALRYFYTTDVIDKKMHKDNTCISNETSASHMKKVTFSCHSKAIICCHTLATVKQIKIKIISQ